MIKISDDIIRLLNTEQKQIIDSQEKYILVSACPGSGKTYTIVRKIEKELAEIETYQGIIACSFTNESSKELENRINKKLETENCFIGTIDSFIKEIIFSFANRNMELRHEWKNQIKIRNKIYFPNNDVYINGKTLPIINGKNLTHNYLIRFYNMYPRIKKIASYYYKEWLEKLNNNEYEISFPTYFFATEITEMKIFQDWFNNKFTTIYVDEAQDLNYFQHKFFEALRENTKIKMVFVGDPNQSIYQFRGAKPNLFKDLINYGFCEYKISVSVRCDPSIIYYANKIYDMNLPKNYIGDNHVNIINGISLSFLNTLVGTCFILCESNKIASDIYIEYKNNYDIIYTKKLDLDNKEFDDYYLSSNIIDELLKYYLNYDNSIDKYKYPYERLEPYILAYNRNLKQRDFRLDTQISMFDFLKKSINKLNIDVSDKTLREIEILLQDDTYRNNYYEVDKKNRVMTIHTSKGLEADNIIIILNNQYECVNDEFKNKLFVAFTRAKKNVFIITKNNKQIGDFINILLSDKQ